MKKIYCIPIVLVLASVFTCLRLVQAADPPPSGLTFVVTYTGTPTVADVRGARFAIDHENAIRAAQDPPGTPLPDGTNAEIKASVLAIYGARNNATHGRFVIKAGVKNIKASELEALWPYATDAQHEAALAALGG